MHAISELRRLLQKRYQGKVKRSHIISVVLMVVAAASALSYLVVQSDHRSAIDCRELAKSANASRLATNYRSCVDEGSDSWAEEDSTVGPLIYGTAYARSLQQEGDAKKARQVAKEVLRRYYNSGEKSPASMSVAELSNIDDLNQIVEGGSSE